jgi:hypothetical protein
MSRHVGRKQRWTQQDARTYTSGLGKVVYRQDAWYARLVYQVCEPLAEKEARPAWKRHDRWLGPFRRPRNAMVELEREATCLRNRHGEDVQIGEEIETGQSEGFADNTP